MMALENYTKEFGVGWCLHLDIVNIIEEQILVLSDQEY